MKYHGQKDEAFKVASPRKENVAPTTPSRRKVLKLLASTAIMSAHPGVMAAAPPAPLRLVFEVGAD
ncbi:hypothetical protein QO034_15820 [Sedimentitalea sp. JM2-8]|uniref:Uncharacterized protein n=1 Tax=Sedimentitalea xiamensis TaxID=3050037 RepID=A0ABT7FIE6_9RHOB|nr:hypothetical protein [Sedimentitalea xiamensis]MDK3074564.1 hypothetical protein [Sedimentitalea xiamensis]